MTKPGASAGRPIAAGARVAGGLALTAGSYVFIQHTSSAPFSHRADDFIAGFAVGLAIVSAIAWLSSR